MRAITTMLLGAGLLVFAAAGARADNGAGEPFAVPTFHCLGIYWSPPGGAAEKQVRVRYRRQGTTGWKEGLPMRYNPIPGTDLDGADYRGSIVHLAPAAPYEVELALAGTSITARLTAATWSEAFPVGETVKVSSRDTPLAITESGTPRAYRVYDGTGATIDVGHQHDQCITVDASYVVLRGFTLKGAGKGPIKRQKPIGAIEIHGGHDIVIEGCDISDWGRLNTETGFCNNCDSGILSRSPDLARLIVQRCRIHHPAVDGSTWYEPKYPTHTMGAQALSLFETAGNHVIRYSEFFSDLERMYNDTLGGGGNGSYRGSPGADSDIYGNIVSHCWDDGIEAEGGSRNVRIWDNYITQYMQGIGNAPCSIGPLYMWRNVFGRSQWQPDYHGANAWKMGYAGKEDWQTGHQYLFHNTIFRMDEYLPTGGLGGNRIVKHTVSRNNILHLRTPEGRALSSHEHNVDNDYDYDLTNGQFIEGSEAHGVKGEPIYAPGAGFNPKTKTGRFYLAPESPGAGAGEPIPNFSDGFTGKAPDIGAHQRGTPPMRFGVEAGHQARAERAGR